ncbi:MAG TPA: hypothetical protein GX391_07335 [Firmicutes bacterium]|jgi:type II secretory pathway component GspD/PulD (secretin)|nr:hypothetical protein [Bacillota bacterium]HOQ23741.1 hypothetical protein [Bacillota bacterium]HPT66885.1 hypothetical protein [Bacillota bacterium]
MKPYSLRFCCILLLIILCGNGFLSADATRTDLDFVNTALPDVFRAMAGQFRVAIIVDEDIQDKVTLHLSNVTLQEAFSILKATYQLDIQKKGAAYHVSRNYNEHLEISLQDGKLTMDARQIPLDTLLKKIREDYKINLVFPQDKQRITLSLYQVPLSAALESIARLTGYTLQAADDIYTFHNRLQIDGGNLAVLYNDGLLTVEAQNAPIAVVAQEITRKTGVSVVTDNQLQANITVFFQNLPINEGLRALASANNLRLIQENPVLYRVTRGSGGGMRVNYQDGLLSVDVAGADITQLLDEIARTAQVNILYEQDVRGTITARFEKLPLVTGINSMLEANGYHMDTLSDHYIVRKRAMQSGFRLSYDPHTKYFNLEIASNTTISAVLTQVAQKAEVNMVVHANVNGPLNNIFLRNVTLDQVLSYILKGTTFSFIRQNDTYIIGDGANLRSDNDLLENRIYYLSNINAENILNSLPPNFPRQYFVILKDQNALSVTGTEAMHAQVAAYLKELDNPKNSIQTEVVRVKHLKAEEVLKLFPASIPKSDVMVVKEANAIAITGTPSFISRVRNYVEQVDLPNPLILFDVKFIQIRGGSDTIFGLSSINEHNPGIYYDNEYNEIIVPPHKDTGTYDNGNLITSILLPGSTAERQFIAKLQAMIQKDKAKIWASPQITTINGNKANFNVTTQERYNIPREVVVSGDSSNSVTSESSTITIESGIQLTLTPWVSATNDITIEIKPSISDSLPNNTTTADSVAPLPSTYQRSVETTVRVRDGETIIIGGLKQKLQQKSENKLPLLGDVPLVGKLFRHTTTKETESEFIIIITPKLLNSPAAVQDTTKKALDRLPPAL